MAQRAGHDAAPLRSRSARRCRAGRSRRCSASPTLEAAARSDGPRRSRRSRSGAASRVDGLDQHDDARHASARSRRRRRSRARYVVGCDGANCTVRDAARRRRRRPRVLLRLADRRRRSSTSRGSSIRSTSRSATRPGRRPRCPAGPGRRRWEFMRLPDERVEDLNHEARAWELLAPWDVHPGNARLERHAVYTFQARVAERWQDGRVFLAGDAAHQMPPFAGQGMCSGHPRRRQPRVEARPRARRPRRAGRCSPPTTRSAGRAPSPAIDFSIELGKVICVPDPAEAAARDEAMAAGVRRGRQRGARPARDRQRASSPPARRSPASCSRRATSAAAGSTTCTASGGGSSPSTPTRAASTPPSPTGSRTIGGAVVDVGDTAEDLVAWFAAHDVRWALQRPDFHLFGTATDAGRRCRRRPCSPTCKERLT